MFSQRVTHHLMCQPPWRERSGSDLPGSRRILDSDLSLSGEDAANDFAIHIAE
jgi:hypothetical protein